jgi:hypothetical protein
LVSARPGRINSRQSTTQEVLRTRQETIEVQLQKQLMRSNSRQSTTQEVLRRRRETVEVQFQKQLMRRQREMIEDQFVPVMHELQERQLTRQLYQQASLGLHVRKLMAEMPETLRQQLKDDDPLVRLLAVIAVGRRHLHLEADLIACLKDPQPAVRDAAHQALVRVGRGTDLGPVPDATIRQRDAAFQRWRDWLAQQEPPSPTAEAARLRTEADK